MRPPDTPKRVESAVVVGGLQREKLAGIEPLDARILVTSNIGCALHLAAGLREMELSIEIMHPITLLARQIFQARTTP